MSDGLNTARVLHFHEPQTIADFGAHEMTFRSPLNKKGLLCYSKTVLDFPPSILSIFSGEIGRVVQERLGQSSIATTLDISSHTVPGLQKTAAEWLDKLLQVEGENIGKMPAIRK